MLAAHNFYFTNEVTEPQHCYMLIGLRLTANRLSEGRRSRVLFSKLVYLIRRVPIHSRETHRRREAGWVLESFAAPTVLG